MLLQLLLWLCSWLGCREGFNFFCDFFFCVSVLTAASGPIAVIVLSSVKLLVSAVYIKGLAKWR